MSYQEAKRNEFGEQQAEMKAKEAKAKENQGDAQRMKQEVGDNRMNQYR